MDSIEKLAVDYVTAGRIFAALWMANESHLQGLSIDETTRAYIQRLAERAADPRKGDYILDELADVLSAQRSLLRDAYDAAEAGSRARAVADRIWHAVGRLLDRLRELQVAQDALMDRRAGSALVSGFQQVPPAG
ncbi:hypothetical protein [Limimaricola litoreus]|uniref:Uncharacterized protein n=1 Tax=Limimaricola litoreus TaxID=2955316 RepID=A0A9X2FSV1_9RHOB|nr:hypothetical protein [Limimaricola litoreus]MCP1167781.1 hypothetical protein [Limimaricola litoreus]